MELAPAPFRVTALGVLTSQVALRTVFDEQVEASARAVGVEPPPHAATSPSRASPASALTRRPLSFQPRTRGSVITGEPSIVCGCPSERGGSRPCRAEPSVAGAIHMIKDGNRMIPFFLEESWTPSPRSPTRPARPAME